MKKVCYFLPIAALALTTSCQQKPQDVKEPVTFNISNLDTTFVPGNDFYMYATGGWSKANPIKDEYSRYGAFDQLAERNKEQVKGLIEDLGKTSHKDGSIEQKIGDLYAIAMDSAKTKCGWSKTDTTTIRCNKKSCDCYRYSETLG